MDSNPVCPRCHDEPLPEGKRMCSTCECAEFDNIDAALKAKELARATYEKFGAVTHTTDLGMDA